MLDGLGAFQSEDELTHEDTVVPLQAPQSITVASILARSVPVEWYEAVAISQSVCAELQASGDDGDDVRLAADHVAIDANGDVHVAAVRNAGSTALNQMAELLRAMLSATTVPAPLRLALSQTEVSSSLEDWSKSIAYYERPGRQSLIQAVYERAMAAPQAVAPVAAQQTVLTQPISAARQPVAARNPAQMRSARIVPVLLLAVLVAVLSAAIVWLLSSTRSVSGTQAAAGPPTLESTFGSAAAAMGSLVARIPGFRESESVDVVDLPPSPPTGRWIHLPSGRLTSIQASPMQSPAVARSVPVPVGLVDPGIVVSPRPKIASSFPPVTYSAADAGVVPPVAIYPQFPTKFPPYITDDDFAEFDVVVTENGSVESVKARRIPPTMAEAVRMTMSLSAAKTWRFRPGLKDGEPIRYRQIIRVLNN